MQLFKLTIHPTSSFCSDLQSDTFFGAFCWSYKYINGEAALENLIQECIEGKPPIVFSNAFPYGSVPLPLQVMNFNRDFVRETDKEMGKKNYQLNKKFKKAEFIEIHEFQKLSSNGFTGQKNVDIIVNKPTEEQDTIRNMVSRDTGIVENRDGAGNLFAQSEIFTLPNSKFDIYIKTSFEAEEVYKVLELMFLLGIGGNKTVGKGRFAIDSLEKVNELGCKEKANAYMLLSNYIPKKSDSTKGYYSTFVKNGMLDREFANDFNPYKKPLLFIKSGAVFFANDSIREFYGKCVTKVSARAENIIVSGFAIAVPI